MLGVTSDHLALKSHDIKIHQKLPSPQSNQAQGAAGRGPRVALWTEAALLRRGPPDQHTTLQSPSAPDPAPSCQVQPQVSTSSDDHTSLGLGRQRV